ncbi:LOW QUALITY PROTEIN: Fanconi anemia core complex-associated protein 24-like [Trichechus inunguis]
MGSGCGPTPSLLGPGWSMLCPVNKAAIQLSEITEEEQGSFLILANKSSIYQSSLETALYISISEPKVKIKAHSFLNEKRSHCLLGAVGMADGAETDGDIGPGPLDSKWALPDVESLSSQPQGPQTHAGLFGETVSLVGTPETGWGSMHKVKNTEHLIYDIALLIFFPKCRLLKEAESGQDGDLSRLDHRSRSLKERTPPDDTGPIHVPFGSEKWRGSQLAQGMQGKFKLIFEVRLTAVAFYLSNRSCILYVTEADSVAGNGYRKRLVWVRNSSYLQGIVLVEKTQISEQYFQAVQKFTVLDLGMVLFPVASQMEASCLIIQLVQVQEQTKEPNKIPFVRKKCALLSEPSLLQTMQQIPGVRKVKAPLLLQKFPSIQQLSNASVEELEQVIGQAVAPQIHVFFTQSR